MSSIVKATGNFLKSDTFNDIVKYSKPALDLISSSHSYYQEQKYNRINYGQFELSQNQLQQVTQENLETLNESYLQNIEALSDKLRATEGTTASYYSSRGVELYGSAMQDMSDIFNKIQKAQANLYQNYLSRRQSIETGYSNSMLKLGYSKHMLNEQYKGNRWMFGSSLLMSTLDDLRQSANSKKVKVYVGYTNQNYKSSLLQNGTNWLFGGMNKKFNVY